MILKCSKPRRPPPVHFEQCKNICRSRFFCSFMQPRPHAPRILGFQGNRKPPVCINEFGSIGKAGQTPLPSCLRVTMESPEQDSTLSPSLSAGISNTYKCYMGDVPKRRWEGGTQQYLKYLKKQRSSKFKREN